jgi:ATP-dependent exoDNAse (exonuclease V) beta subunit
VGTGMKNKDIEIISASAGTGKTYRLMELVEKALLAGECRPEELMAITYTKKAAAELKTRVRQKLLESGNIDLAYAMNSAKIGTVHSVCSELLSKFAYEAGNSPYQRVIVDGEDDSLFHRAMGAAFSETELNELTEIALTFETDVVSILNSAKKLVDLARQNNISPQEIKTSIPLSQAQILQAFPKPGADLDAILKTELVNYCNTYKEPPDATQTTEVIHKFILQSLDKFQQGRLTWKNWLELATLKPAKKSLRVYEGLVAVVSGFAAHPKLHRDLKRCIELTLNIAATGLKLFEDKKRNMGVIDFGDMESQMLLMLNNDKVCEKLNGEIKLLLVDEFQDSNPIQLAIFIKLSKLCARTVWVGDAKQSIYGFNGADPVLMQNVLTEITKDKFEILKRNYRSCSALVEFTSGVFEQALLKDGFKPDHVRVSSAVEKTSELNPLEVWRLPGKNMKLRYAAMATKLTQLLSSRIELTDRMGTKNKIQACDIAILVRSNDKCAEVVAALAEYGITASYSAKSLLAQPEVVLVLTAYRYVIDPSDNLAAVEISLLMGTDPAKWFTMAFGQVPPRNWSSNVNKLDSFRGRITELTPTELLDAVISVSGIDEYVERLENGSARLSHLAALRAQAFQYENSATQVLSPCTPLGFLVYLDELKRNNADKIPSWSRPDAIEVCTYHKAKGLEWPIVILMGTDAEVYSASLFQARVVGPLASDFDCQNPLANRSLRYLPWPFGKKEKVLPVEACLSVDFEMANLNEVAQAEALRLLYVGMTRAKAQMIFAVAETFTVNSNAWLGMLTDTNDKAILQLPTVGSTELIVGDTAFKCECLQIVPQEPQPTLEKSKEVLPDVVSQIELTNPLYYNPSRLKFAIPKGYFEIGERIDLGGCLSVIGKAPIEAIGDAIHLFLSSDQALASTEVREARAQQILKNWSIGHALNSLDLVLASDRFRKALEQRWPDAEHKKEVPLFRLINADKQKSFIKGSIDWLTLSSTEVAIIDHKTTQVSVEAADIIAQHYIGQLTAYSSSVALAEPGKKVSTWLHFPMAGLLIEVNIIEPAQAFKVLLGDSNKAERAGVDDDDKDETIVRNF